MAAVALGDEIEVAHLRRVQCGHQAGDPGVGDGRRGQPENLIGVVEGAGAEVGAGQVAVEGFDAVNDRGIAHQPHPGLETVMKDRRNEPPLLGEPGFFFDNGGQHHHLVRRQPDLFRIFLHQGLGLSLELAHHGGQQALHGKPPMEVVGLGKGKPLQGGDFRVARQILSRDELRVFRDSQEFGGGSDPQGFDPGSNIAEGKALGDGEGNESGPARDEIIQQFVGRNLPLQDILPGLDAG